MSNTNFLANKLGENDYLRFHQRKMYLENELKRLQQSMSYVEFNAECKELLIDYVVDARKEINFINEVMQSYLSRT